MIRTNLVKPRISQQLDAQVSIVKAFILKVLVVCFIIQLLYFGFQSHRHSTIVKELEPLKKQFTELQKQNAEIPITDTGILNSSVEELNQWFQQQHSPLKYLSIIETNKPPGIEIQKIDISNNQGTIIMLAPDMNYSAQFTNTVFRNVKGNLSLIEKTMEGFVIQYQWAE